MISTNELQRKFPTRTAVANEIINLEAILNLPKPTEAFMSDLHGEYDAFQHVLRNGSGNVRQKINECFQGEMTTHAMKRFAFLVYYPKERIQAVKRRFAQRDDLCQWYLDTFKRLIRLLEYTATKYTRSKLRKALAPEFVYITEELLYDDFTTPDKREYYQQITTNLIKLHQAEAWIVATCRSIQQLTVDHWHIVGDIYDRGPAPDKIVEQLIRHHSVDIQWGNHDILWLGGAAGSPLCIANLVRISARYNNLSILEDRYGINLRHLALLAEKYYDDNPKFRPKISRSETQPTPAEVLQITKIHQAIAMIQFKLEGPVIRRRPEFEMDDRLVLENLSTDQQHITLDNQQYELSNQCFQTVSADDPYQLLPEEQTVMDQLVANFTHSERLKRHMDFLVSHGQMFQRTNHNLLIHGCVPVTADGQLQSFTVDGKAYQGQSLFQFFEHNLKQSYAHPQASTDLATDLLWYLWTGPLSPLFGKTKMTTFERYFIADETTHDEGPNAYYRLRHEEWFIDQLLTEFGLDPATGHLINGHTPVKKGQSPILANRKMIVIDGGFAKAYQPTTGIGGYTLLDNSFGMQLVTHQPFTSKQAAIEDLTDIISTRRVIRRELQRRRVADTDIGTQLKQQITELKKLLADPQIHD